MVGRGTKIGGYYETAARKIDVSKEFRDFRYLRDRGYIVFDPENKG